MSSRIAASGEVSPSEARCPLVPACQTVFASLERKECSEWRHQNYSMMGMRGGSERPQLRPGSTISDAAPRSVTQKIVTSDVAETPIPDVTSIDEALASLETRCKHCGEEFVAKRKDAVYCSVHCRQADKRYKR